MGEPQRLIMYKHRTTVVIKEAGHFSGGLNETKKSADVSERSTRPATQGIERDTKTRRKTMGEEKMRYPKGARPEGR